MNDIFALDATNAFIVGENNTFLLTTNGGTNWTSPSIGGAGLTVRGFGVRAVDANTVWIAGYSDGAPTVAKLYKLTKSGSTWTSSLVYSSSGATFRGLFLTDSDNVWTVGSATGGTSGLIHGQITPLNLTTFQQSDRPGQYRVPVGTTLDVLLQGDNIP
ncbi:MAG: hypothetical protein LAP85_09570 [Acidobacteriia bacterium]|nr:hypothetical protein [Terriglobia bacterium]